MTQNTVRDSRESPDKQENGILNRLAYLIKQDATERTLRRRGCGTN